MLTFLTYFFFAVGIGLLVMMLVQGLRGTVPLISLRNFFLIGFVVFQCTSAALAIQDFDYEEFPLINKPHSASVFAVLLCIFLGVFLWAYRKGWFVRGLADRVRRADAEPGVASMITLSLAFMASGLLMRLVLVYIPIFGKLSYNMGTGLLVVASAMAIWVYAPRLLNPVLGCIAAGVFLVSALAILQGAYGRRDMLSLATCVVWGAYHGYWKHLGPKRAALRIAIGGGLGLVALASMTATRGNYADAKSSGAEILRQMVSVSPAKLEQGVLMSLHGQAAAQNSMWIIEHYPDQFAYTPLNTGWFFLAMPVPRDWWPDKPMSLGVTAVDQWGRVGRGDYYTIGAGLIGHIYADNPYISMLPYAIVLALFLRFLDEVVVRNPYNPFIILPAGVALGQVIGFARGDPGLFLFQTISGVATAWLGMLMVSKLMRQMGWSIQYEDPDSTESWNNDHGDPGGDSEPAGGGEHDEASERAQTAP